MEHFSHPSRALPCSREHPPEIIFKNILSETSWQRKHLLVCYLQKFVEGTQGCTRQCKAHGTVCRGGFLTFCELHLLPLSNRFSTAVGQMGRWPCSMLGQLRVCFLVGFTKPALWVLDKRQSSDKQLNAGGPVTPRFLSLCREEHPSS